jgi:hypothetical protein
MPEPWETPKGQACIEKWIAESMAKLNKHVGNSTFNANKPWSIDQYGAVVGRHVASVPGGPTDFPHFGYNKYHWMWAHYQATEPSEWHTVEWRAAKIAPLQSFVLACMAK